MENRPERIPPEEAKKAVDNGALLVSAYDGEKFEKTKIGNAIPASEFADRASDISNDRTLVFY